MIRARQISPPHPTGRAMTLRRLIYFSIAMLGCLLTAQSASAGAMTSIFLKSGNGTRPGRDTAISMLVGPLNSAFPGAITASQFASARSGPDAYIVGTTNALWKSHLTSDPSAEWISTNAFGNASGSTALYAIDFMIPDLAITSATLDFEFLIDNELGDSVNEGLFINTTPVAGTKHLGVVLSSFQVDQSFPTLDITSLVNPGLNTLYINAVDRGGPSALQFSAALHVDQVPVPEPTSLAIFGIGVLGLVSGGRRRRRKTPAA